MARCLPICFVCFASAAASHFPAISFLMVDLANFTRFFPLLFSEKLVPSLLLRSTWKVSTNSNTYRSMRPHEVLSTTLISLSIALGTSRYRIAFHVVFVAVFLLNRLVTHTTATSLGMCGCEHRYDLLTEFYNATNGSTRWGSRTGWGTTSPCSTEWYGVTCNGSDVTFIQLPGNYIQGTLPNSWWNMSGLQQLYLYSNSLSGTLPASWGNMPNLQYLSLYSNSLSGTLPASWSNMSRLQYLYLSSNSLSGTLPASWGNMPSLWQLLLYSNSLSGTLPASWSNMSRLQYLSLYSNSLSGTLPASWGNMSGLRSLLLFSNSLSGTLPASWGNMSSLQTLSLYSNSLSGTLPASWGTLSSLQTLSLYSNSLSGTLPASWGNMSSLQTLSLYSNSLSGTLPASWGNMPSLQTLSLYSNSLSGTLPASWGNMSGVRSLHLYSNSLSGTLPASWGNMSSLQTLHLSSNSLSGTLPASWGDMSGLWQLSLYSNSLSGTLPASWGNMSSLQQLYLSSNSLSGTLPVSWGNMSSLQTLSLFSNSLSGTLPASWGNTSGLQQLYLYSNSLSGTLPASWGDMSGLWQLSLYSNSLSGTLPASWGNMSSLQNLYLSTNSLRGTLPVSWGSMSALQLLDLGSNSLSGTLPASWSVLLCQILVSNNCLTGSIPTTFSLATSRIQRIDVCNTGIWPRNFSQNIVAVCTPNTIRRCMTSDSFTLSTGVASLSRSAGSQSVLASMSMSNKSSTSLTTSLSLTTSKVATGGTLSLTHTLSSSSTWLGTLSRTATTLTLSSPSLSCMSPTLSCGTVEVKLMPFNSSLAASAFTFVDVVSPDANNELFGPVASHIIVVNAIDRAELLQDPVLRMNISLMMQAFNTKRWDLANITMTGIGPLRFTIVNRSDDVVRMRWLVALVDPPTRIGGWITDSVPLLVDATFSMNLLFSCDVESTLSVTVTIPSTGISRALAGGIETSAKSTQIISLLTTGGAGSSLGRMLTTRSLILCDADSAMNGGVLDLGIVICATASTGGAVVARSAIVSNLLLIIVVFSVLTVAMLSFCSQMPASMLLSTFCFPSSLLPAVTVVTPSTAAAATYLLARLGSSACVGGDVLLGVVGLAVAACPCCFIVHVWTSLERHKSEVLCERVDVRRAEPVSCIETTVGVAIKGTERRWKWRCNDTSQLKYAWVLLLDVRLLWYAVMDSALLVVIAIAAVVGGLNGSGDVDSCRGWSIAVIVLMCLQLLVLLFCQPFTSLFANVHAALTLALTCLSTVFQLALLYEAPNTRASQLWLIESSAVCGLIIVGVSGLKTLVDLRDVAAACRRRFTMQQTLRTTHVRTDVRAVSLSNEMPSEAENEKIELTPIDAVLLDHQPMLFLDDARDDSIPLSDSLIDIEDDMLFWDNDGRAVAQDVDNHATQMHLLEAEAIALLFPYFNIDG